MMPNFLDTGDSPSGFFAKSLSRVFSIGIATVCIFAVGFLQASKLSELSLPQAKSDNQLRLQLDNNHQAINLELLEKIPAFGFDNLIADWTFLSYLQYFGDSQSRKGTNYALSADFFDVIVSRDPRFISPYQFLSTSVSLYAGQPKRGVQLLEKGLQSLDPHTDPNAYLVWLYKATDELLFLGDNQSARNSYQKVVEWAKINGDSESQRLSTLSARTVQFLANKPNSKSAQINAWLLVFVNAVDDNGRQRALENIKQLGGEVSFGDNGSVSAKHPPEG